MAYDLEEQEQLAAIKDWWRQYGNLLTWLLVAGLAAYTAWTGWNAYQQRQVVQAAQLYEELQRAVKAKDNARTQRAANDLSGKFGGTAYARMGALAAAKSAYDANDAATAKAHLKWASEQDEDHFGAIARIRLAGILLDEKAYDEALKLLDRGIPEAFAGLAADRKGDVLVAQSKIAEAREAYRKALEKTDEANPGRQLIQMKLDAIGGAAKAAA
jgi:predicted negative regulator of RcsB-dependent stress response